MQIFRVPESGVVKARESSQAGSDTSLLDELVGLGFLKDLERDFLQDISMRLLQSGVSTLSGFPPSTLSASGECAATDPSAAPSRTRSYSDLLKKPTLLHLEGIERYRYIKEHARGGMGRILTVWDNRMGREVALKELLPDRIDRAREKGNSPKSGHRIIGRFLQEAQITGRLQHPSIIPVYEIGERVDGTLYYTMKLVRGQTLRQAIDAAKTLEDRMALLPHYVSLCQAMAYAHTHGVIHRDLKPSNVMIGEFGETLVIDWGLAKEMGGEEKESASVDESVSAGIDDAPGLTLDGQLLGTPHYMAPEQASGKQDTLDKRSDVYALGAVLYQLLTGSPPFDSLSRFDVLRHVVRESPAPPESMCPEIPVALAAICKQAMALNPNDRYDSAKKLAREILRFQSGAAVAAHDYSIREHIARIVKKHRPVVMTAGSLVLLLVSVVTYAFLALRTSEQAAQAERVTAEEEGYAMTITLAQRNFDDHNYDQGQSLLDRCSPTYRNWEWGRLAYAANATRHRLPNQKNEQQDGAISPDGKYLLSADGTGLVTRWDAETGKIVRTYADHRGAFKDLVFHPSGTSFAACFFDGDIVIRDTESGAQLSRFQVSENSVMMLAYTPDGKYLLTAGGRGELSQWNWRTGREVRRLMGGSGQLNAVAVSADGKWVAAGDELGWIYAWDWESGERRFDALGHEKNLHWGVQGTVYLDFRPGHAQIASSGCDRTAKLWDLETGNLTHVWNGHQKKVYSLAFSPDGSLLATGGDRTVGLWDPETGEALPTWMRHKNDIFRIEFFPDGSKLLTLGDYSPGTIWNIRGTAGVTYLVSHTAELNAVRFSDDGRYLVSVAGHWRTGGDTRVLLWKTNDYEEAKPCVLTDDLRRWGAAIAYHPAKNQVAVGDGGGWVHVWDLDTHALVREFAVKELSGGIRALDYSPDGRHMVAAGWRAERYTEAVLLDAKTGVLIHTMVGHEREIDTVRFSFDGRIIATGSRDTTVRLWDAETGKALRVMASDNDWVNGVAFHPNGKWLASSHQDTLVQLRDMATGEVIRRFEGLHTRANAVAITPDGTRIASCGSTSTMIWNVETGALLLSLPQGGHSLDFSPDGRTLVTAGYDGKLGIWQTLPWE